MTTLCEGELEFTFPSDWSAEAFDDGQRQLQGFSPVDFVVERDDDILLIEVKDPSQTSVPASERDAFVRSMRTKELTHQQLVPKARSSWWYLHLMARTTKPLRYVVVIGAEALSLQPLLLTQLRDRLRSRLDHEGPEPWVRQYIADCVVLASTEVERHISGVRVERVATSP